MTSVAVARLRDEGVRRRLSFERLVTKWLERWAALRWHGRLPSLLCHSAIDRLLAGDLLDHLCRLTAKDS